jgi:hypothetical protein
LFSSENRRNVKYIVEKEKDMSAKKLFVIVLVMAALCSLVACGGKTQVDENAAPIVGKWEHESGGFTYEFKADGAGAYTIEGDEAMKFTYEDDGKSLSIKYDGDTAASGHEYSIEGDTLNIQEIMGTHSYKRK